MHIQTKAEYIRLAARFAAKDDIRYYLNGVAIQPAECGGIYIVATNGHFIGVFHDAEGQCDQRAIIPVSTTMQAACKKKKKEPERTFTADGIEAQVRCNGDLIHGETAKAIDGTYPDWTRVVPKDVPDSPAHTTVNPLYMKIFGEVVQELAPKNPMITVLPAEDPNKPAILTCPLRDDFFGVVMPVSYNVEPRVPGWLPSQSIEEPEKEEAAVAD